MQPQPKQRPTSVCEYYHRGSCLRLNCRFFHGSDEQLKAAQKCFDASAGRAVKDAKPEVARTQQKKPIVCLSYLSGNCFRENCRFTHLPSHIRPLPPNICSYHQEGACTRTVCRFFHGSQETLSELRANGVTFYNPSNNEPYDLIDKLVEGPPQLDEKFRQKETEKGQNIAVPAGPPVAVPFGFMTPPFMLPNNAATTLPPPQLVMFPPSGLPNQMMMFSPPFNGTPFTLPVAAPPDARSFHGNA